MIAKWPREKKYCDRYFVPDLSIEQRAQLQKLKPRIIFVAESPFESEVAPEACDARRPLCGKAGRDWWKMVAEVTGVVETPVQQADLGLERLLRLCRHAQIIVMNAVQFPLDPKITNYCGEGADPMPRLGFTKVPPVTYKKAKNTDDLKAAVKLLRARLQHPSVAQLPVVPLGNDAEWFVQMAIGQDEPQRLVGKLPHPSAWWRQGGKFRDKARAELKRLIGS